MICAMVGRLVIWGGLAVAAGYGLVGAYIWFRLFFTYCQCDFIHSLAVLAR
ncbi:hypothetical protein [Bradyrhizobium sp. RT9a]|uniref:hypothetical protein n=1 Tax=Bradyrhizobium sp. RT9a TaxID=3156384 RepID=UPI0033925BD0